jgi:hypothetical protein
MAVITVTGEPGCRVEEAARLTAQRLQFDLFTASALRNMVEQEFGPESFLPDKAYRYVLTSILARLATEHHLVACVPGAELLVKKFPGVLRIFVVAPESRRLGSLMLDRRLERPAAKQLLEQLDKEQKTDRRRKFGRAAAPPHLFDLVLNEESLDTENIAELIESAARAWGLRDQGLLSEAAETQLQFHVRLQLAKHGISPPGHITLKRKIFVHPSEEIFANLLDFYRIAWEYEPRSFPIQWDKDGKVLEAFTPDFYLPEFDLYVELTTMKQAHVTKKNRKVKLLKAIYPHVNIQVFYQKDFQNLIFKYGLVERPIEV